MNYKNPGAICGGVLALAVISFLAGWWLLLVAIAVFFLVCPPSYDPAIQWKEQREEKARKNRHPDLL